ncbi:hypothetical protein [Dactylosporangium matsuzakiense]|uniref:Glycosyl hydrolase n=1 Tax=Dactylosporangium matsuzakiense TaxID=53360 RepID=A0A9W6KNQ1_9ACTN|nr:hypothetical protein [Dactylosporangium matsuzakiense]UWZ41889.1 hypothetical protein Dmats_30220 [Dactylosporangium matsuzakiense]GLL04447.1 hypothetical protein GCM10017581_061940 [Dactylosporangium matsuzakiense]
MTHEKNDRPGGGMTRRGLLRLTGAAAAAAGVGAYLGIDATPAAAKPFYRAHGPLLTSGYQTWLDAIHNQGANLAKVVTGWGLGSSWSSAPDFVWTACGATDYLIVRTTTGDTTQMIDANQAIAEIRGSRFFEYKAARSGPGKCIIEIGNEPNAGGNDAWVYGANLSTTIDRLRTEFPGALICGTALSPNKGVNPDAWYNNDNYKAAVAKCDFVGVHFYSNDPNGSFTRQGDVNELTYAETLQRAAARWPGKPVIATEYSIREPRMTPHDKGYKYASLIHFDDSVAGNLWGATYYHVQTDPSGPDPNENVGSGGAVGYRERLNAGGL